MRIGVVLLGLVACSSKKEEPPAPPPKPVNLEVTARLESSELPGVRVTINGEKTGGSIQYRVTADADKPPTFEAHIDGPCGTASLELLPVERHQYDRSVTYTARVAAKPDLLNVAIDNRGGKPARIKIGERLLVALANDVVRDQVFVVPNGCTPVVTLEDGKKLGEVPAPPVDLTTTTMQLFIDMRGNRCYKVEVHTYAMGGGGVGVTQKLRKQYVHVVDAVIDHFFENPPRSVTTEGGVSTSRVALKPAGC
jgi:hypothetical protein